MSAEVLCAHIGRLVTHESPSSDLAAVAASARTLAALGTELLGRAPEVVELEGRTHLRWRFGASTRVLLVGHHDTVWPLGSLATHPFAVVDGVLTGPGSFDMKAGVVMALHAVAGLAERDGVTLLVTGDEELGSPTSRTLIEHEATGADAALVLEASGPGGALKTERKGVSLYTVRVHGRAAHAGLEPERGVNATVAAAHATLAIAALADPAAGTTVTPTVLHSGTTGNTVPAEAAITVDVRLRTAAEQDRVDLAIRALEPAVPGSTITVDGGPNRPPLEAQASAALFRRADRLSVTLGLPAPTAVAVGGASDGNFTAGIGVPTLDGLGAVGGGAHADDEHVIVGELAPRTRLLTALIDDLLQSPDRNEDS
ncbi:M20/M25/M40 family metallo-hydrolase [Agromyces aerolatus]|uniref:M20/M25/M40 family metallo-hydrolase n=1 Tax=Agromyces sp. LY-1074 TaxID=3074080 RepID=UPI0028600420|nr:M20/M25/M40 family metallo-hydrolase [Agromyces sp. LY-1074]MDR5699003.1 M20/M25/M40 family metallo-hydrolase [Agromyces sp. LY-1074]MDR5705219.1 M20/M25/M40 family metallo-hydrolase [Agromyces sp. LY-1358]